MVFVLKSHQAPGKRVVKLLLRELDEALAAFAREPFTGKEIHAVRRCGKRSRALLRLDRRALPPGGYEREENCWRKVGQSLGPVRDAEVLGNTVVRLRQHYATQISAGACESVRERFLRRKERALQAVRGRVPRLIRELTAARTRISRWRLKQDWDAIWKGFSDSYRQGRRACRDAQSHPNPEHRHEWRKRVKDLLYQTALLEPVRPTPMQKWERDWDRLAARLGQEHDLQELLKQLPAKRDAHSATQQFARLAQRWAANLQLAAAALGSRLHAERTRPLVKRLRHHARGAGMK